MDSKQADRQQDDLISLISLFQNRESKLTYVIEISCGYTEMIFLVQGKNKWRAIVSAEMILVVPWKTAECLRDQWVLKNDSAPWGSYL
jgi:hypothetical protein